MLAPGNRSHGMRHVALAGLLLAGGGCASILSGANQTLTFESDPPGALVTVAGRELGKTPVTAAVKRGDKNMLVVELEGYKTYKTELVTKTNILTFLNAIFLGWGVLSSTTDANSGAIRQYAQDKYMIMLVPAGAPALRVPETKQRELKEFVVVGYSSIQADIARGRGEYLNSLYSMLELPADARKDALEKLRALSTLYKEIPTFADKIAEQFLAGKPAEPQQTQEPLKPAPPAQPAPEPAKKDGTFNP